MSVDRAALSAALFFLHGRRRLPSYFLTVIPADAGGALQRRMPVIQRLCSTLKSGFDVLRPPSHFLLLAHDRAWSAGEQRSWPEGRRAGRPESEKVTKENGTLRPSSLSAFGAAGTRLGPGFSTGLLPWRKGTGIHARPPAGLFVPTRSTTEGTRRRLASHRPDSLSWMR